MTYLSELDMIGKEYNNIYREPDEFVVWFHNDFGTVEQSTDMVGYWATREICIRAWGAALDIDIYKGY